MNLQKIAVKFYVTEPGAVALPEFIPVFHHWIQKQSENPVGGLLIDVADYSHVQEGPGVVLIGHEADYFMDTAEGPLGLLYNRKSPLTGSAADRLRVTFRQALTACAALEQEPELKGKIAFRGERVRFIINDRLIAPNTDETFAAVRPDLESFLQTLYANSACEIKRDGSDLRRRFTVDIQCSDPVEISSLLPRLSE